LVFGALLSVSLVSALSVFEPFGLSVARFPNGTLYTLANVTVQIYPDNSGGSTIYEENFTNRLINGTFAVVLGQNSTIETYMNKNYFYDLKINGVDQNFTNNTGGKNDRLPFTASRGWVNASYVNITGSGTSQLDNRLLTSILSELYTSGAAANITELRSQMSSATQNITSIILNITALNTTVNNMLTIQNGLTINLTNINASLQVTQDTLANWINISSYTKNGSSINDSLKITQDTLANWRNITGDGNYSVINITNYLFLNGTNITIFLSQTASNISGINATLSSVNVTLTNLYFDFGGLIFNQSQTNTTLYDFMPKVVANISGLNFTINSLLTFQSAITFNVSQINLTVASLQTGQSAFTINVSNINASLKITQDTLAGWTNVSATPSYTENGTNLNASLQVTQTTLANWRNVTADGNYSIINVTNYIYLNGTNLTIFFSQISSNISALNTTMQTITLDKITQNASNINLSVESLRSLVQNLNDTRLNRTEFTTYTDLATINSSNINASLQVTQSTLANWNNATTNGNYSSINVTNYIYLNGTNLTIFNAQVTSNISGMNTTQTAINSSLTQEMSARISEGLSQNTSILNLMAANSSVNLTAQASNTTLTALLGTACGAGDFVNDIGADGTPVCGTPAGGDLSGITFNVSEINKSVTNLNITLNTKLNQTIIGNFSVTGNFTPTDNITYIIGSPLNWWLNSYFWKVTLNGSDLKDILFTINDTMYNNNAESIKNATAVNTTVTNLLGTTCSAGQFVNDIASDGTPICGTPVGGGGSSDNITNADGNIYMWINKTGDNSINMFTNGSSINISGGSINLSGRIQLPNNASISGINAMYNDRNYAAIHVNGLINLPNMAFDDMSTSKPATNTVDIGAYKEFFATRVNVGGIGLTLIPGDVRGPTLTTGVSGQYSAAFINNGSGVGLLADINQTNIFSYGNISGTFVQLRAGANQIAGFETNHKIFTKESNVWGQCTVSVPTNNSNTERIFVGFTNLSLSSMLYNDTLTTDADGFTGQFIGWQFVPNISYNWRIVRRGSGAMSFTAIAAVNESRVTLKILSVNKASWIYQLFDKDLNVLAAQVPPGPISNVPLRFVAGIKTNQATARNLNIFDCKVATEGP